MSYANCILYGCTLPTYNGKKDKDKDGKDNEQQKVIKADDPRNKEQVSKLIASFK